MNGSRPEKEFKIGPVRAAIWSNPRTTSDGRSFNSMKVAVERIYRDSDGNFKSTGRFDTNDIPKLIIALNRAYEYLVLRNTASPEGQPSPTQTSFERVP